MESGTPDELTRRRFLAGAVAAGLAGGACSGGGDQAAKTAADVPDRSADAGSIDRRLPPLVIVALAGGNDALNTVVPYTDGRYHELRGGLALDPAGVLATGDGFGLHPSLARSKQLWDAGRLAVVHGVGFDGLDRSHFHCMDVWHAGGTARATTGWLGRWLDLAGASPLDAVVVGSRLPLLARGETTTAAVLPPGPFALTAGPGVLGGYATQVAPDDDRNDLEAMVARTGADLLDVSATVTGPLAGSAEGETLADHLDVVAALVAAGLPTRAYAVELRGFDTHAGQLDTHAALLGELDGALGRFFDAVGPDGATVLVYSEFGRRVAPNGSDGTDHGQAGTVLVAGRVRGGHHGDPPPLDGLQDGDLRTTTPVTAVYGALLERVLATPATDVLDRPAPALDLVP